MKEVRFALVGCGRVSTRHVEALQKTGNARIVAVCDRVPSQAQKHAQTLGVPAFNSTEDLYRFGEFDVVDVATPSGDHYERVLEALFHQKHVVTEKPVALRLSHVDEMAGEAEKRNLKLWVAFQNRYNPAVRKVKDVIEDGRLGKPILGTVRVRWCRTQSYYDGDDWHGTWAMDGGVLSQQAIHHLDALQWMFGEVESVDATLSTRLARMECEDLAIAKVQFKSGALGLIEATTATRPRDVEASLSLLGEGGIIVLGGIAINKIDTFEFADARPGDEAVPAACYQEVPNGYGFGHDLLYADVVSSILKGTPVSISARDARKSIELLHALYASHELGRRVLLSEGAESRKLGIRS